MVKIKKTRNMKGLPDPFRTFWLDGWKMPRRVWKRPLIGKRLLVVPQRRLFGWLT